MSSASNKKRPFHPEANSLKYLRDICNLYKRKAYDMADIKNKSILDLGSGKLGDFWKLIHGGARIMVGIDVNEEYTREGRMRINQSRQLQLKKLDENEMDHKMNNNKKHKTENNVQLHPDRWTQFHLFSPVHMEKPNEIEQVVQTIPDITRFDVVTAFFSIHTIFQNKETLQGVCDSIDRFLIQKSGARFIATFMDGNEILKWMKRENKVELKSPGNFSISLSASVAPERVTLGLPIQVEMNAQTVDLHTEYLTSLDLLQDALEEKQFQLIHTELFQVSDHNRMSDMERCWLECNRLVCFQRV